MIDSEERIKIPHAFIRREEWVEKVTRKEERKARVDYP